jgi:hypothetical protein
MVISSVLMLHGAVGSLQKKALSSPLKKIDTTCLYLMLAPGLIELLLLGR